MTDYPTTTLRDAIACACGCGNPARYLCGASDATAATYRCADCAASAIDYAPLPEADSARGILAPSYPAQSEAALAAERGASEAEQAQAAERADSGYPESAAAIGAALMAREIVEREREAQRYSEAAQRAEQAADSGAARIFRALRDSARSEALAAGIALARQS